LRYVALETFTDPTDGVLVTAGMTYVDGSADVYRMFPSRFREVARDEARGGTLTRIQAGTTAQLTGSSSIKPRAKAGPFGYDFRQVEFVERGFADFSVDIGSGARNTILEEIRRARQESGDIEVGGWLFAGYLPRHDSRSVSIAYATLAARGTSSSVIFNDPIDAIVLARNAGIDEHWKLTGDWHAHTCRGSELPSLTDARSWAGTSDMLGRSAYVSLIVSPSAGLGWMHPKLSAWVARRHGLPSRPVVERARLAWD
jgi:Prokaryotic homologs of the JAB domain